jgi:hypothetical protein
MNIHISQEIRSRFPAWEFRGKPFSKNGLTWMRAKSKIFYITWYYCFEWDQIVDLVWYQLGEK